MICFECLYDFGILFLNVVFEVENGIMVLFGCLGVGKIMIINVIVGLLRFDKVKVFVGEWMLVDIDVGLWVFVYK